MLVASSLVCVNCVYNIPTRRSCIIPTRRSHHPTRDLTSISSRRADLHHPNAQIFHHPDAMGVADPSLGSPQATPGLVIRDFADAKGVADGGDNAVPFRLRRISVVLERRRRSLVLAMPSQGRCATPGWVLGRRWRRGNAQSQHVGLSSSGDRREDSSRTVNKEYGMRNEESLITPNIHPYNSTSYAARRRGRAVRPSIWS